jgi:hypothetical protein
MRAPGTTAKCYVSPAADPVANLKKINLRVSSELPDWSEPRAVSDGFNAVFFMTKNRVECRAFFRLGPRWQGGYWYIFRGYLCDRGGSKITDSDFDAFVAGVSVAR